MNPGGWNLLVATSFPKGPLVLPSTASTSVPSVLMVCAWDRAITGVSGQGDQMWVISLSLLLDYA